MKRKEIIYLLIAVSITAVIYHYSKNYGEETEKRVEKFVEEKETNKDTIPLIPLTPAKNEN